MVAPFTITAPTLQTTSVEIRSTVTPQLRISGNDWGASLSDIRVYLSTVSASLVTSSPIHTGLNYAPILSSGSADSTITFFEEEVPTSGIKHCSNYLSNRIEVAVGSLDACELLCRKLTTCTHLTYVPPTSASQDRCYVLDNCGTIAVSTSDTSGARTFRKAIYNVNSVLTLYCPHKPPYCATGHAHQPHAALYAPKAQGRSRLYVRRR